MQEELWSRRYDAPSYSIGHRQRPTHDFFFFFLNTWRQFPSHAAKASIHPVFTVDFYSGGCLYLISCSIWGALEYNRPDAAVILSPQGVVCLLYHFLGGAKVGCACEPLLPPRVLFKGSVSLHGLRGSVSLRFAYKK